MNFLKIEKAFDLLTAEDVVDQNFEIIEGAQVSIASNGKEATVTIGNESMRIVRGLYEFANAETEILLIDFNKTRARRISKSKMKETTRAVSNSGGGSVVQMDYDIDSIDIELVKLKDVEFDERLFVPIKTGTYLDEFVSRKGGFLPGINIMITGDPGVGKSSNLIEILVKAREVNPDIRVLYVSAEMDRNDVREFQEYYEGLADIEFFYLGEYVTDPNTTIPANIMLKAVLNKGYDLVVMDSLIEVQSTIQEELELSRNAGEKWVLDLMSLNNKGYNKTNAYTSFLAIQQKNKSGQYVGSKRLEHMTAAFLQMCWDNGKRYMIFEKNRKGKEKVKLYYSFTPNGIKYDEVRHKTELEVALSMNNAESIVLENWDFNNLLADSEI